MSSNRELFFRFQKQGVSDAVIYFALEEVNGFNHFSLLENFDKEIKDENQFVDAMNRFIHGEMIEYIFNKAYFLNKPFYINKDVLIPRQETEQLVLSSIRRIKELFKDQNITIADVCTGSGVIGLSIAQEFKESSVILTDISKEALNVATKNVYDIGLSNVSFMQGNMLEPLFNNKKQVDVIICNPPYIADISTIDKKTWEQEPHLALLASPATKFYEEVLKNYQKIVKEKYLMAFEIGEDMEQELIDLINKYCHNVSFFFEKDLYDKTRFLFIVNKKV